RANGWDEADLAAYRAQKPLTDLVGLPADKHLTRQQLIDLCDGMPASWLPSSSAAGDVAAREAKLTEYFEAGADEVILHGVVGGELTPLAEHYRSRGLSERRNSALAERNNDAFPEALAAWLADRLREESGGPVTGLRLGPLERPEAGQSSEVVIFAARWQEGARERSADFVLRRQPGPGGIFLRPDAIREARVLRSLAGHSKVPVPAVRWIEPDARVLGAPFFVMERVSGRVPAAKPSIHSRGWLVPLSPAQRRRLWESAMDVLVAVHATPWRESHDFLLEAGEEPGLRSHLRATAEWYRWAADGRRFP